jgi:hypothetical protein
LKKNTIEEPSNDGTSRNPPEYEQHSKMPRRAQPIMPTRPPKEVTKEIEPELDEDISFFKRVVQEIIELRPKPSNLIKFIEESRRFSKGFMLATPVPRIQIVDKRSKDDSWLYESSNISALGHNSWEIVLN